MRLFDDTSADVQSAITTLISRIQKSRSCCEPLKAYYIQLKSEQHVASPYNVYASRVFHPCASTNRDLGCIYRVKRVTERRYSLFLYFVTVAAFTAFPLAER